MRLLQKLSSVSVAPINYCLKCTFYWFSHINMVHTPQRNTIWDQIIGHKLALPPVWRIIKYVIFQAKTVISIFHYSWASLATSLTHTGYSKHLLQQIKLRKPVIIHTRTHIHVQFYAWLHCRYFSTPPIWVYHIERALKPKRVNTLHSLLIVHAKVSGVTFRL